MMSGEDEFSGLRSGPRAERIKELLDDLGVRAPKAEASTTRFETDARLISSLAWAVEQLLTCGPEISRSSDEYVGRVGDVARIIRERARALESAAKMRRD
jgi:hypothetical protein